MSRRHPGHVGFVSPPSTISLLNEPTSTADSSNEELGDADEPPDEQMPIQASIETHAAACDARFIKSDYAFKSSNSLLTRMMSMSESESLGDDEDCPFSEANRTQSSASTYSRGSVASGCEMMSEGHPSPHQSPPSHILAAYKSGAFLPISKTDPIDQNVEKHDFSLSDGLGIKAAPGDEKQGLAEPAPSRRHISFACGAEDLPRPREAAAAQTHRVEKPQDPTKRPCTLKFLCPTRPSREGDANAAASKQRTRLASPPPPPKSEPSPPAQSKANRASDSTVQNDSPVTVRKIPISQRNHRDSASSDISRPEATRFHEFATSEEEPDDWTQESTCFQRRLTIEDTLAVENDLRKLAREVEDEEDDEDDDGSEDEDEEQDHNDKASVGSSGYESDKGFHSDDEHGFAHSDDENAGSEDEWWAPGRSATGEHIEHIRPSMKQRRGSGSTTASDAPFPGISADGIRKQTRPVDVQRAPELPDSTDFVCGTLDEDKPLEQAYLNHLAKQRAAKHRVVPQDFDPTFPTSDPDMSDENGEDDESDHAIFLHGQMDLNDDEGQEPHLTSTIPRKRSPTGSPKRLRSPPPAKRVHRSPPPPNNRRHRSPAPALFERLRISSSVPRDHHLKSQGPRDIATPALMEMDEEDNENTPRVNRGAIAIVMGLERRKNRRRERLYDKHCRAKAKNEKKPVAKGRGAERMRDLGVVLNAYRGRKAVVLETNEGDKQILSY